MTNDWPPCPLYTTGRSSMKPVEKRQDVSPPSKHTLIEEEKAAVGGVKLSVYLYYAKSIGLQMSLLAVVMYLGFTAFSVFSSIWLSIWSTDPAASLEIPVRNMYLSVGIGRANFFELLIL